MKSLFWDKIPDARLAGSVWQSFAAADWVDFDEIEERFQQAVRNKNLDASKAAEKPKQLNLLDLKRCTAVGIRMARLKVPWQGVGAAILSLDGTAFEGAEDIGTVLQCLPSEEEKGVLQAYRQSGKPIEAVSEAERFVMSLMDVPRATPRLRAFALKFTAAEKAAEATAVFRDHISACKELQSSATFKQLLAATLAVGNFLNHGSRLGNAPGFRLKGLNKLHDSRSTDGKSTMLQALARQVLARGKDIAVLSEELPHVISSKLKISWQEAADMLDQVEAAAQQISRELEQATQQPEAAAAAGDAAAPQQQQGGDSSSSSSSSSQSIKVFVGVNKQQHGGSSGESAHGTPGRGSSRPSSAGGAAAAASKGPPSHSSSSSSPAQRKQQQQQQQAGSKEDDKQQQQQQDGGDSPGGSRRSSSAAGSAADVAAAAAAEAEAEQSLVTVRIVVDNFVPVMSRVLASIKGCQAELALLRDRSASAWEALLRHYGETKQSVPTDTEFWADMQVFVERFSSAQKAVLQEEKDAAERKQRLARAEAKKAAAEAAKKVTALAASSSSSRKKQLWLCGSGCFRCRAAA
ncbi:hypothetical protein OEZ85_013518 [Tetradesmus obliquus]|uniref:Formin-like protein n=1 Tax=Tetradesmus obliquus TaxID=3088 RepID=A0ABY8UR35_TETOB|nr:hypothetical protein OEZ85_013518 [Tetradesmus obliquus]